MPIPHERVVDPEYAVKVKQVIALSESLVSSKETPYERRTFEELLRQRTHQPEDHSQCNS